METNSIPVAEFNASSWGLNPDYQIKEIVDQSPFLLILIIDHLYIKKKI
jgi:hypothetical protein